MNHVRCYQTEESCTDYTIRSVTDHKCAVPNKCTACLAADSECVWDSNRDMCSSKTIWHGFHPSEKSADDIIDDAEECPDAKGCITDTGGTCKFQRCAESRGGNVQCLGGKCICTQKHCSRFGVCYSKDACPRRTGGTCDPINCDQSRKAMCVNGECVCDEKSDMCAFQGKCWAKHELFVASNAN